MMNYYKIFLTISLAIYGCLIRAQETVSLGDCYKEARKNYPLVKKSGLLEEAYKLEIENLHKSKLPQINWEGTATIQSEAISVPITIPGTESGISVPIYNAQTYVKASYSLYDGGFVKASEATKTVQLEADKYSIELELFRLYKQINDAFFGVLIIRARDSLLNVSINDLNAKLETLQAGERNGVVLPSEVSKLQVQILKLESGREELLGTQKSLISILNALTGKAMDPLTVFLLPEIPATDFQQNNIRPELEFFDLQKKSIESRAGLIDIPYKPKVRAFLQTGLGYPNPVNFFEDKISPFAVAGVNFQWNLFDYGKRKTERQQLTVQSLILDNQKETFEYNLNLIDQKYKEDIAAIDALIQKDKAIAGLQKEILEQMASQLKHGVIQVNDYLTEVNANLQSELNVNLRQLERKKLLVEYLTQKGVVLE